MSLSNECINTMAKPPKTKKITCAFCQGKGIQPGAERLSCIVCKGSGRITVGQPYSICKECGGQGKKAGANLYCLSCHGRGFIEESRYPSIAKPPVSKTRKKRGKKSVKSKVRKVPTRTAVKKERKSFFKKFLGTLKFYEKRRKKRERIQRR